MGGLRYKRPVIPLRLYPGAELPYRLGSRQFIDFTASFDVGLARLRRHLDWLDSPEGILQELRQRLQDAERELPRTTGAKRARTEQDLEELRRQVDEQRRLLADPRSAIEGTERRIASGLEREREPEQRPTVRRAKFINPPSMAAPSWFQDRYVETAQLADFLREDGLRLLTLVGRGGVGKTALACRLLRGLQAGRFPDELGAHAVAGIVCLSPVGAHQVSFPNLFGDLCRLLPEATAQRLERLYRDPRQSPQDQVLALLEALLEAL